ncbi:MAG: polysaccharide pyruvyl transferase family protein, partial [Candidatus Woesearchaeota archaeon]
MKTAKKILIDTINKVAPNYLRRRLFKKINKEFYNTHKHLKNQKKIIYVLTPPKDLRNIGDHAQAVAIYNWFKDYFFDSEIIEVDKHLCYAALPSLKKITREDDIIFLHSGGNMGDRGLWSEGARRNIILNFPKNKIVSLPQTIHFSNTDKGLKERNKSAHIYNSHKDLTIIGRDLKSGQIAKELFFNCTTYSLPDFVLYLNTFDFIQKKNPVSDKILFCIRNDSESLLGLNERKELFQIINKPYEVFDTTLDHDIQIKDREKTLKQTLEYFNQFGLIVTDRYHGLIFATLLQKPTIVFPTIDHK